MTDLVEPIRNRVIERRRMRQRNFGPIRGTPAGTRTARPDPWRPLSARSGRSASCMPTAPRNSAGR